MRTAAVDPHTVWQRLQADPDAARIIGFVEHWWIVIAAVVLIVALWPRRS